MLTVVPVLVFGTHMRHMLFPVDLLSLLFQVIWIAVLII